MAKVILDVMVMLSVKYVEEYIVQSSLKEIEGCQMGCVTPTWP